MTGNQLSVVLIVGIIAAAVVLCRIADAFSGRHKGSSKEGTE
jgi:hypothetical protein